jgi:hypothetical protein
MKVFAVAGIGLGLLAAGLVSSPATAKGNQEWNSVWTSDSEFRDFAYALVEPTPRGGSLVLTGSDRDRDEVLRQGKRVLGPFVWIRSNKDRYLIRDAATIAGVKEVLEPELRLNGQESRLGDMQARIGDMQASLGDEQAKLGDRQAELGDRQARLADRVEDAGAGGSRQKSYDREQLELSEAQAELGRAQGRLGEKQEMIGREQSKLSAEQGRFSRNRAEVQAKVRADMRVFLQRARAQGLAEKL